jgi:hypothetical protein
VCCPTCPSRRLTFRKSASIRSQQRAPGLAAEKDTFDENCLDRWKSSRHPVACARWIQADGAPADLQLPAFCCSGQRRRHPSFSAARLCFFPSRPSIDGGVISLNHLTHRGAERTTSVSSCCGEVACDIPVWEGRPRISLLLGWSSIEVRLKSPLAVAVQIIEGLSLRDACCTDVVRSRMINIDEFTVQNNMVFGVHVQPTSIDKWCLVTVPNAKLFSY